MTGRTRGRSCKQPWSTRRKERSRRRKERSSWTPRVPGRKDPGCPDSKTREGPNPPGRPGCPATSARVPGPCPGHAPAGLGCPAQRAQPAPGARPTSPGCPGLHLAAPSRPRVPAQAGPGARPPHQAASSATPGARDLPPGARPPASRPLSSPGARPKLAGCPVPFVRPHVDGLFGLVPLFSCLVSPLDYIRTPPRPFVGITKYLIDICELCSMDPLH